MVRQEDSPRDTRPDPAGMTIFSPGRIGGRTAPNRFVAQAMEGNDAVEGGRPSALTLERYRRLGRGRWGVTVVEALSVVEDSLARVNGLIINDRNLESLRGLVKAFREENNEGLLLFQITHSGPRSGRFSRVVSSCPDHEPGAEYLSTEEIEEIRKAFVNAVLLAHEAGADGVDFKLCHGYLGAELLRPSNTRPDRWGGSFGNRTRFLRESLRELEGRLPRDRFILGSRISMYEAIRGGCGTAGPDERLEDITEMLELLRLMDSLGMDYVNVSAGIPALTAEVTRPTKTSRWFHLHHFRYARAAKALGTRMAVFGSAYSILAEEAYHLGEENLRKGYADFIGFGRQNFADPLYPAKLLAGEKVDYCTACSGCSRLMAAQLHDGCIIYNPYYRDVMKTSRKPAAE